MKKCNSNEFTYAFVRYWLSVSFKHVSEPLDLRLQPPKGEAKEVKGLQPVANTDTSSQS